MPRITTFMYSEGTAHEPIPNGQRLHIVSPLLVFTPVFIPGTMSFSVTVGILEVEPEREHSLQIKFFSSTSSEPPLIDTGSIPIPVNGDPNALSLPPEMRGMMLNFGFQNVIFRNEGIYHTEILFDGESLGKYPIQVKGKEKLL